MSFAVSSVPCAVGLRIGNVFSEMHELTVELRQTVHELENSKAQLNVLFFLKKIIFTSNILTSSIT